MHGSCVSLISFFEDSANHRDLHSFPTRRSSDLILSKTDALDEEKWLNMLGTFVKDWFRYESHFVHGRDRSDERFSRNAEIGRAVQQECRDRSRMPSSA